MKRPPLVLVHGLWDTPRVFARLERALLERCPQLDCYAPHLPHRLGAVPIRSSQPSWRLCWRAALGRSNLWTCSDFRWAG